MKNWWAKLRYVLLDPAFAFAVLGLVAVLLLGFDAVSVWQGATVSTVLTIILRLQETVSRPGDAPTPPDSDEADDKD